jgi:lipopolysaccharide assembly outer membrane protein LptD (OstA)
MSGMTRLTVVMAVFLAGATAVRAQTGKVSLAVGPDVSADHMSADSNYWFRAAGNVFIRYADHDLRADQVDLNTKSGEVRARGHIELFRPDQGRWTGEALDYNYITKEGLVGKGEARMKSFAMEAQETRALTNGMKKLIHGRLTTCANTNSADWHYWITASEIDFRENDRVTLYEAVPYFMGVPFFYMPYATRDLNHPFGPRIIPGFRSSWGPFLLSTYTYPIYNPPGKDQLIGDVLLDYRATRGLAYGHQVNWRQETLGEGLFGFYLTDDQNPSSRFSDRSTSVQTNRSDRYRLYLQHEANPTPDDQVLVRGELLSDQRMLEDFFPDLYRERSQPDNFFDYTHRGLTYASGVDVAGPLNNTFNGVGRVPEGWLRIFPQELFEDSGLYYESDNSAGYFVQQWAHGDTFTNAYGAFKDAPEGDTVRLHSRQKLTYPLHAFEVVSIVPRAAYDYTFYSHMMPDSGKTNETRSLFELGAESSVNWFANYGDYRHLVEPYVDYAIVTSPLNVKPGENYFFDRVDGPREWKDQFGLDGNFAPRRWHGVRPGVRNAVQVKDDEGNRRTVFDWDVFVAYRLGNQGETNASRLVGWDTSYRPTKDVRLRTQGLYDQEGGRLDQSDSSLTVDEGRNWSFELGYFTSDPLDPDSLNRPADPRLYGYNTLRAARIVRTAVTHRFNSYWSANTYLRYNLEDAGLDRVGGYLQYDLDCLSFRLDAGYIPEITRYDGSQRPADYRVDFNVMVKALEAEGLQKLSGW